MALFAWGLDEIAETIGLFYVLIVGLLILLVALERNLDAESMPQMQLVRRLSRQWLDGDADIDPRPVQVWLKAVAHAPPHRCAQHQLDAVGLGSQHLLPSGSGKQPLAVCAPVGEDRLGGGDPARVATFAPITASPSMCWLPTGRLGSAG